MKSFCAFFILLMGSFFIPMSISALSVDPSAGLYNQGESLNLILKANPTDSDQNAISVRVSVENSTILDFIPDNSIKFVAFTKDCNDGDSFFTSSEICFSVVKNEPLLNDEVLGTIIYSVSSVGTAKLNKVEGTFYSNGSSKVKDIGLLSEFYTDESLNNLSFAVSSPLNNNVDNTRVVIVSTVVLLTSAVFILLFIKRNSLKQLFANKKTRVIILIIGFGLLISTFGGAAVIVSNNQALDQSSAAVSSFILPTNCDITSQFSVDGGCSSSSIGSRLCYSIDKSSSKLVEDIRCDISACEVDTGKYLKLGDSSPCLNGSSSTCNPGKTITKVSCGVLKDCSADSATHGQVICKPDGYSYKCNNGLMEKGTICKSNINACEANKDFYKCLSNQDNAWCGGSVNLCYPKANSSQVNCVTGNDENSRKNIDSLCGRGTGGGGVITPPVTPPITISSCPSTQPRFSVVLDGNQNLGLVAGGTFELSRITKLESVVVINNDPAQKFTSGKVVLTGPNSTGQIVQLASNSDGRTISIAKQVGTYTLVASVGSQECARTSIEVISTKISNTPNDQRIGGDTLLCGEADINKDGKLTIVDYSNFVKLIGKKCVSAGFKYGPCGSTDSNLDGKIDIIDVAIFGRNYNKPSCATSIGLR